MGTAADVHQMYARKVCEIVDVDQDGLLNYEEFKQFVVLYSDRRLNCTGEGPIPWLLEKQDRIYQELNRLDPNKDGVDVRLVPKLFYEVSNKVGKLRFEQRSYYPSIEIHAIGENDGDLTWYEALSEEEKRLINQ